MPRTSRVLPKDGYIHIVCRGNNKQFVFQDDADFTYYKDLIIKFKNENDIEINHYCLMQSHVHFIVHIKPRSDLARFMKQLNVAYFYYFRKKYNYSGHLWQGRYKSYIIAKTEYLMQCGKYLELNPVRAGIVKKAKDYDNSSYKYYAYGQKNSIITEAPEYAKFGKSKKERENEYRKFVIEDEAKNFKEF